MIELISPLRKELNFLQKLRTWFGSKSVIVLTMGKVGTLSICNSLQKIDYKHVHPHSLVYSYPGTHFLKNIKLPFIKNLYFTFKTVLKKLKVYLWKAFTPEIVIITGVRDPFSRYISAFFEQSHYLNFDTVSNSMDMVKKKLHDHGNFESTLEWFEKEIKNVFGINIYDYNFDQNEGFSIIKKGKIKIFIYRLDKLDGLEEHLKVFLNSTGFKLISHNITENNLNYSKLKKEFKFNDVSFDKAKNSNYLNHFYSEQEICLLKNKWIN
jgi:hypothetical protein